MAQKSKEEQSAKVEKKSKRHSKGKKMPKEKNQKAAASAFNLLADDKTVDPTLSSLFAVKQPPVKAKPVVFEPRKTAKPEVDEEAEEEDNDAELSALDEEIDEDDEDVSDIPEQDTAIATDTIDEDVEDMQPKRKRKRKDGDEELEEAYMSRLVREGEKEDARLAAERAAKRQKQDVEEDATADDQDNDVEADEQDATIGAEVETEEDEDEATSPPPKHETEVQSDQDVEKANRTVFLGNVSTGAISSKTSLKALKTHLTSFFPSLKEHATHKLESIRFRSTPYASAIPKKAAFAKKELMDATTKSTNAYAVYSSPLLAREASKRLNGTLVLDRHLRVDEVAHPSKIDHRRCIFVGNLGFVDDESNIQDANEDEGREKRKRGKQPADVEEGLWRTFSRCGPVESVRVVRDSTTRVGKGIAYVQFHDENAVEAALLYHEKKFPPMLPRKLRVSRAKAQKRNAKPGSGRPGIPSSPSSRSAANGYKRKLTGAEASRLGRTGKLLGRAAAAHVKRGGDFRAPRERSTGVNTATTTATLGATAGGGGGGGGGGAGFKKPESFIFEGHRASSKQGTTGLKLGGKHAKKSGPRDSSGGGGGGGSKITKRSASFRAKRRAA